MPWKAYVYGQNPRHRGGAAAQRLKRFVSTSVNGVRSMDFMHDRLADSHAYRLLANVDIYSRECVGLEVASRFG